MNISWKKNALSLFIVKNLETMESIKRKVKDNKSVEFFVY